MKFIFTLLVLTGLFTPYMAQSMFVSVVDPNQFKPIVAKETIEEPVNGKYIKYIGVFFIICKKMKFQFSFRYLCECRV